MKLPDMKEARIRTKNPVEVKKYSFDEKYKTDNSRISELIDPS